MMRQNLSPCLRCVFYLICLTLSVTDASPPQCSGYGQFYGGSLSYTLNDVGGQFVLHLDVITGWALGKGPCGRNCTKQSIGHSTKQSRHQVENDMKNTNFFGEWQTEIKRPNTPLISTLVTDKVRADMNGIVLAVSEASQWEQELMRVNLPVEDHLSYKDIYYDGCSWRNLSRQGELLPWHIQAKIDPLEIRSDTKQPNGSPQVLYKPFYRLVLNRVNTVQIAVTDPDDDFVRCGKSIYIESGVFAQPGHTLPGVTIDEDCSILINTSSALGFRDQDLAAVVLIVRDFNKAPIHFGNNAANMILPGMFSLSSTAVQFMVQVVGNLEEPEFVSPTLEGNHVFYLYADTIWTTKVYARALGNATIQEFSVRARGGEKVTQSVIMEDLYRAGVKYITLTWKPAKTDKGNHIVCVTALDNSGTESSMDRCFIITVGDKKFTGVTYTAVGKPYFYSLPRLQDLTCLADTTCIIPLYVKSPNGATITSIKMTQFYVGMAYVLALREKGPNDYQADLHLIDSQHGVKKLCFIATDSNGSQSNETCIDADIIPKDPCSTLPCQNSSPCKRNPSDPSDYVCICDSSMWSGKNCDNRKILRCDPNPCLRGVCNASRHIVNQCQCPVGYGGIDCGTKILVNCTSDPCKGNGVCSNSRYGFKCDCFNRYSGQNCSTDICPGASSSLSCLSGHSCTSNTCNGHGFCSSGGTCICSYGYIGSGCQTGRGDLTTSKIRFVQPTPEEYSSLNCYFYTTQDCIFNVFFSTPHRSSSNVTIDKQSSELQGFTSVGPIEDETNIPGTQHLYRTTVTISRGHGFDKRAGGRRFICITAVEITTHSSDHRCYEIVLMYNSGYVAKSQEFLNHRKHVKFLPPTPLADSTFVCQRNVRCYVFLYTSLNSPCEQVFAASADVTVFTPHSDANSCVTEASFIFNTTGQHYICFLAAATGGQTRCYNIHVYSNNTDPCVIKPCLNGGLCFHKGLHDSYCVCPSQYIGDKCQRGPCLASDNTCNAGFCYTDSSAKTCICPIGYNGSVCSHRNSPAVPYLGHNVAVFTDSALPKVITCIKNKPCTVPFILSGKLSLPTDKPILKPGYVDPGIKVDHVGVTAISSINDSFNGHVQFTPSVSGTHDVCVQTTDKSGMIWDEICFTIDVKTDTSTLYGFKEYPHFIEPSIPASSVVSCGVGEPCHLVFHATPGDNHTGGCVTVEELKKNFQYLHVFSSCDCADGEVGTCTPCSPGQMTNNNCSIDVSILPTVAEVGTNKKICLQAKLSTKMNEITGEERCLNVTVEALSTHRKERGCQALHCQNGGFCDGHGPKPVCYCTYGYTGDDCRTDITTILAQHLPSFLPTGFPSEVTCFRNETCKIPFQVLGKNKTRPDVTTAYVDPHLKNVLVNVGSELISSPIPLYNGSVVVRTPDVGKFRMCIQTRNVKQTDEKCFKVGVKATRRPPVDMLKPYFIQPSPLPESTITCDAKNSCIINLFYTSGDMFGFAGKCPVLSQSISAIPVIHVFAAKYSTQTCTTQLNYIAQEKDVGSVKLLCFRVSIPGKKGEDRCFNVRVELSIIQNTTTGSSGMYFTTPQGPTELSSSPNNINTTSSTFAETGITCLDCQEVSHLYLCNTVKRCHISEMCSVKKIRSSSGFITYRTGCMDKDSCSREKSEGRVRTLSQSVECLECCGGSFCNSHGCDGQGLPDRANRGPMCYDCQHVEKVEECNTVTLCHNDEVCSIQEFEWGDTYKLYSLGCAPKFECTSSKRSTPVCEICCSQDYCNTNCTRTMSSVQIIG